VKHSVLHLRLLMLTGYVCRHGLEQTWCGLYNQAFKFLGMSRVTDAPPV
jgi:hypothetical protein